MGPLQLGVLVHATRAQLFGIFAVLHASRRALGSQSRRGQGRLQGLLTRAPACGVETLTIVSSCIRELDLQKKRGAQEAHLKPNLIHSFNCLKPYAFQDHESN